MFPIWQNHGEQEAEHYWLKQELDKQILKTVLIFLITICMFGEKISEQYDLLKYVKACLMKLKMKRNFQPTNI